jgi:Protein of unknown function DUF262
MSISSPQPSVLHLLTLFRQITAGDIRIPAFQRGFVWSEKQIVELLNSVADGFPIGSILLWNVENETLRIAPNASTAFPDIVERYPMSYVLDGMQRLSTLYGVFHFGVSTNDKLFDVLYDLHSRGFFHRGDVQLTETAIPLSALFVPRELLEHQRRLSTQQNSETLMDGLLNLHAAFQEYMIPVVAIKSNDINRIVEIFERVNSTGTRLDPVDFMRAITWAEDFDLNDFLERTSEELKAFGFYLSDETIIKCVGLTLGIPPTTADLLKLRNQPSNTLSSAFSETIIRLKRVAEFLYLRFRIQSSEFVPYEGQLLLLLAAVGTGTSTENEQDLIERWFWSVGFNEALRGKPDHYVVRAISSWRQLIEGKVRGLEPRLKTVSSDFLERRVISGGALSTTFITMHAVSGAHDIYTGEKIDPPNYMRQLDINLFETIYTKDELDKLSLSRGNSAKVFGNVILSVPIAKSRAPNAARSAMLSMADADRWDVLSSQFINRNAVSALRAGNDFSFVLARVKEMHLRAAALVGISDGILTP